MHARTSPLGAIVNCTGTSPPAARTTPAHDPTIDESRNWGDVRAPAVDLGAAAAALAAAAFIASPYLGKRAAMAASVAAPAKATPLFTRTTTATRSEGTNRSHAWAPELPPCDNTGR